MPKLDTLNKTSRRPNFINLAILLSLLVSYGCSTTENRRVNPQIKTTKSLEKFNECVREKLRISIGKLVGTKGLMYDKNKYYTYMIARFTNLKTGEQTILIPAVKKAEDKCQKKLPKTEN